MNADKSRHRVEYDPEGRVLSSTHEVEEDAAAHIVDGDGTTDGLNRPGPRYLAAGKKTTDHALIVAANVLRDQAREQMFADAGKKTQRRETRATVARVDTDGDERSRAWRDQVTDLTTAWSRQR
jgi:hypothetical protein